jgi:hypothetical protein
MRDVIPTLRFSPLDTGYSIETASGERRGSLSSRAKVFLREQQA